MSGDAKLVALRVVAVVGPSGCGKTTALQIVAGLEHATGPTSSSTANGSTTKPRSNVILPWHFSSMLCTPT